MEHHDLSNQLIEQLPDALLVVDGDGRIIFVNAQAQDLFGWRREELLGQAIEMLVPAAARSAHPGHRAGYLEDVRVRPMGGGLNLFGCRKDGSQFPAEISLSPVESEDGQLVAATVRDVTERKAVEAAVSVARDVGAPARSRQEFLANLSHEIRTPMNAIIGMTSLLLDTPLESQQRDYLETLRGSGEHLLTMVNDLLDYATIDAGALVLEEVPFDARDWVAATLDLVALEAGRKGLALVHDVAPEVPEVLFGDSARLRQIVLNLLSNAVKFTHAGEVFLRFGMHRTADAREWVRIVVSDTGVGIAPDRMESLFEPFTQVDNTSARAYGGTGLGLAISRRLAEGMGGWMSMESAPDLGTTATLLLPFARRSGPPAPAPHGLTGQRLLVVDANASSRATLAGWATRRGIDCLACAGAGEALEWVDGGETFDVAVVDLPGAQSAELGNMLRLRSPRSRIVLLDTDRRVEHVIDRSAFDAVLVKPVREDRLFTELGAQSDVGVPDTNVSLGRSMFDIGGSDQRIAILVVEDTPVNQKVAQHLLARFGFRSDVAASGYEALEALGQRAYDLVLMDVQMPGMDGLEATRRLRQQWPDAGIQVVAMTADVGPEDVRRCYEAGMDGFLAKPIDVRSLARLLQLLLAVPTDPDGRLPVLDAGFFAALGEELGSEVLREITTLFLVDLDCSVPVLVESCRVRDRDLLAATAHRLKGSARSLGAAALSEHLHRVEQAAVGGEWSALATLVDEVELDRESVREQIRTELAAVPTGVGLARRPLPYAIRAPRRPS